MQEPCTLGRKYSCQTALLYTPMLCYKWWPTTHDSRATTNSSALARWVAAATRAWCQLALQLQITRLLACLRCAPEALCSPV
jgi:hypothetical protein